MSTEPLPCPDCGDPECAAEGLRPCTGRWFTGDVCLAGNSITDCVGCCDECYAMPEPPPTPPGCGGKLRRCFYRECAWHDGLYAYQEDMED
jgi:hypothetical protein